MSVIGPSLVLCLVLAADGVPAPKLPPGKDTTYVTGPLDKDGYIDYEAALNDRLGKGVTPETNANVLIWKALGPTPEGGQGSPPAVFKRLGIDEPPKDGAYFISLGAFMRDHLKLDPSEFERARRGAGPGWQTAVGGEGPSPHRRLAGGQREADGPRRRGDPAAGLLQPADLPTRRERTRLADRRLAAERAEVPGAGDGPDRPRHAARWGGQVRRRLAGLARLPPPRPSRRARRYAHRGLGRVRHRQHRQQRRPGVPGVRRPDRPRRPAIA